MTLLGDQKILAARDDPFLHTCIMQKWDKHGSQCPFQPHFNGMEIEAFFCNHWIMGARLKLH